MSMLLSFPLEFSHPENVMNEIEKIVLLCNRDYVLLYDITEDIVVDGEQYYRIEIHCPKNNFSSAYWYFGILWERNITPLLIKLAKLAADKQKQEVLRLSPDDLIWDIEMSTRARAVLLNILSQKGIGYKFTISDVAEFVSEKQLKHHRSCGNKIIAEINTLLNRAGLILKRIGAILI